MAPAKDRRPSSSPLRSSAGTPTASEAGSRNALRFAASRTADVATRRARPTAAPSMIVRYSASTSSVRAIASG